MSAAAGAPTTTSALTGTVPATSIHLTCPTLSDHVPTAKVPASSQLTTAHCFSRVQCPTMTEPASPSEPANDLPGLTNATVLSLGRTPIRTRESAVTLAAWRMEIACDEGRGSIVLFESAGQGIYRGEGLLLGWPQSDLSAAYQALIAAPEEPPEEILQLG